jgi:uncharacterized membrane protein YjjP (DUF1212 family)
VGHTLIPAAVAYLRGEVLHERLNNGGWAECLVVFAAVACGRFAQLALARKKINQLACVLVAAAISCAVYVTVTTAIRHLDPGAGGLHASAFTSSVLFLVPGFPLTTAALDLVFLNDGQITLALANDVQAALIVASRATGLVIARVVTDRSWTLD